MNRLFTISPILNLGHWDLFEIWYLVLGIFLIFVKQAVFVKIAIYLSKCRNLLAAMDVLDTYYRLPYGPVLKTLNMC
jgi:hypothetical protein